MQVPHGLTSVLAAIDDEPVAGCIQTLGAGDSGRAREDRENREEALGRHAAVADRPSMRLVADLLRRRARGDQRVEAAGGAAGR